MKLLLTNDDGIDAPGIDALRQSCEGVGSTITIAPHLPHSGDSHRVTIEAPISVRRENESSIRVHGTPADCVRLALTELAADTDWVLAGINRGANAGTDSYLSGTVAAVREAALLGKPGIAFSQYVGMKREVDWTLTARRAARVLRELIEKNPQPSHFWSVNLPHPESDAIDLEIVYCDLDPSPLGVRFRQTESSHESDLTFEYAGDYHGRPRVEGRDVDVCFGGRIAVTKIPIDLGSR